MTCDCSFCGPFCAIPLAQVLGWPKNIGHATAPHQAMLARFAQKSAQVMALSATGEELTADLVVTEGHKHNALETLLWWRQLGAWPLIGRTLAGALTVGQIVSDTANEDLGLYFFRLPINAALTARVTSIIYPRLRATVPTPGAPAASLLIVTGELVRVGIGGSLVTVVTLPPLNLSAVTNRWFTWGPIEIPDLVTDLRFGLRLRARVSVAAQQGTALEVAVGLREGL